MSWPKCKLANVCYVEGSQNCGEEKQSPPSSLQDALKRSSLLPYAGNNGEQLEAARHEYPGLCAAAVPWSAQPGAPSSLIGWAATVLQAVPAVHGAASLCKLRLGKHLAAQLCEPAACQTESLLGASFRSSQSI